MLYKRHEALQAASTAFISGFRGAMLVTFFVLSTATVLSAVLLRPVSRRAGPAPSSSVFDHERE
jgi:hypothetical protein